MNGTQDADICTTQWPFVGLLVEYSTSVGHQLLYHPGTTLNFFSFQMFSVV